jgi:hypothetical protein
MIAVQGGLPSRFRARTKENRSRGALTRPSSAHHHNAIPKIDSPPATKEGAERRKAHANHSAQTSRPCGLLGRARQRALSGRQDKTACRQKWPQFQGIKDAPDPRCPFGVPISWGRGSRRSGASSPPTSAQTYWTSLVPPAAPFVLGKTLTAPAHRPFARPSKAQAWQLRLRRLAGHNRWHDGTTEGYQPPHLVSPPA